MRLRAARRPGAQQLPAAPMRSLLLVLVCAVLVAACGGNGDDAATPDPTPAQSQSGGKIQRNAGNAKTSSRSARRTSPSSTCSARSTPRACAAAGYTIKTTLDLGDQDMALAALKAGRVAAYPEYTGTALIAFFGKSAEDVPKDPQQAYEQAKRNFAAQGLVALAADAVHVVQRGRRDRGDRRPARAEERSPTWRARRRS